MFGRIPNYIVHKYKSYLRGLEVFFGDLSLDPSTKGSNSYPRAPPTPTPSRVLPVCDNCHNASTIFKDSNKTLGPRLEKLCRRSLKTTKAQTSLCIHVDWLAPCYYIISHLPEAFYRVTLLRGSGGGSPLYGSMGEAMWQKIVLVQSKGLKEALKHAKTRS